MIAENDIYSKQVHYSRRLLKLHDPYGILLSRVFGQTQSAMNRMLATSCCHYSIGGKSCGTVLSLKTSKVLVMEYGALYNALCHS